MKKGIVLFLMISLVLVCAGCGSAPAQPVSEPVSTEAPVQAPAETPVPVQEPESAPQAEAAQEPAETEAHSSVLVVYFSATGTTRGVAERIASLTGADLVEIVPAQPYTAEDLNYNDRTTRATVEQNTPDARPGIANFVFPEFSGFIYSPALPLKMRLFKIGQKSDRSPCFELSLSFLPSSCGFIDICLKQRYHLF